MTSEGLSFSRPAYQHAQTPSLPDTRLVAPTMPEGTTADAATSLNPSENSLTTLPSFTLASTPLSFPDRPRPVQDPDLEIKVPMSAMAMLSGQSVQTAVERSYVLSQPTALDMERNRDLDLLKQTLREISPELEALVDKPQADGRPLFDNKLNYSLMQILVSLDPDLQKRAITAMEKCFAGQAPDKQELALLASLKLSWKDNQLFDQVKNQPVTSRDQLETLQIRLGDRRIDSLKNLLNHRENFLNITPAEQDLLAAYGLYADRKGQLYNLVDNSDLGPQQLEVLRSVLRHVNDSSAYSRDRLARSGPSFDFSLNAPSLGPVRQPQLSLSIAHMNLNHRLAELGPVLSAELAGNTRLQAEIEKNRRAMESKTEQLTAQDQANASLRESIGKVRKQGEELQQEDHDLKLIRDWAADLPPGASLSESLAGLPAERREQLLAALERQNIAQRRSSGELVFTVNPRGLTRDNLLADLDERRQHHGARLQRHQLQLQFLQSQLQSGMERSRQLRGELDELRRQQDQQTEQLRQSNARIGSSRDELLALKNDPALWNQLSPEQQQEIEHLLAGSQQALQSSADLLARVAQTRKRADEALEKSLAEDALNRTAMQDLGRMIGQAGSMQPFDPAAQARRARADELTARLLKEADRLGQELKLMPKPLYVGIEELLKQWEEILRESSAAFNQQFSQNLAEESLGRSLDAHHAQQLKQSLDYHLGQLDKGRTLSQGQLHAWLEASIARMRSELQPQ